MATPVLNTSHALYGNVVRGLVRHPYAPRLVDSVPGGSSDLADQTNTQILTAVQNANVTPVQGLATDGTAWFEINTTTIERYLWAGSSPTHTNSTPFASLPAGTDHCGGGFCSGGYLFVSTIDWDAATQTSTSQRIAKYNASDLSYVSAIDISGASACNNAGCCIGHTGNIFVASFYNGASDARQRDIYEFDSSGTQIAVHTMSADIVGIQGIDYDPANNIYIIGSYNTSSDYSLVIVDSSWNVLYRMNPTGMSNATAEQEDVCYYNGNWYTHENGGGVRVFNTASLYISSNGLSDKPKFLAAANVPAAGSIVIRGTPATLFDFNSLWDNLSTANDWESWIYLDGRLGGRINSAQTAVSAASLVSAGTEAIFGFSWNHTTTVDYDIVHNGSIKQTKTGVTWVTAPDLYLGGANASNTDANFTFRDVVVYNKRLSSTEWSTLAAAFDDIYAAGQPYIKRAGGVPGMRINRGVW